MATNSKVRCKGTTRAGKPCGAPPTQGGLCFFHANPNQARELGRAGGRKNRYLPLTMELPNVLNTAAANDLIRHAIGGLLSNELDPRHATARRSEATKLADLCLERRSALVASLDIARQIDPARLDGPTLGPASRRHTRRAGQAQRGARAWRRGCPPRPER